MNLRAMIFGNTQSKAHLAVKDAEYERADERLRKLAVQRAEMRDKLSEAMRKIIEEQA